MRIARILQREFGEDLREIHQARLSVTFAAVAALFRGRHLSLTGIGRAIAVGTTHKHGIKRVDRLLGNGNIWAERIAFYRSIARRLIPEGSRPSILVDWTGFDRDKWSLVAAVSFEGRAVVVYAETHRVSRYLKPAVHRAFLRRLRDVLPRCVPIVVTDAGFRTPWMREVSKLGWDYITRLRGRTRVRHVGSRGWCPLAYLYEQTSRRPKDFGQCDLVRSASYEARVVGVRKGRPYRWAHRDGTVKPIDLLASSGSRWTNKNKVLRGAREPWILATSLDVSAARIVRLYRDRMQIEETFRDAKSDRFGFSMTFARSTSEHRADILMLLLTLAHLVSILAGLVALLFNLDRGYQANTVRHRRVLSLCRLGRLLLAGDDARHLAPSSLNAAWRALLTRMHANLLVQESGDP